MRYTVSMFWRLMILSFRAQMEYKLDFIVSNLFRGLISIMDFLMVAIIMLRFDNIDGWNVYQVALLFGVASMAMGFYRTLASAVHNFEEIIINGEFDSLLIRPLPTLLTLIARRIELRWFGNIFQSMAVMIISGLALDLSPLAWGYLFMLPLAAAVTLLGIALATITLGFWLTRIDEFIIFTMYAPSTAASFPLSVFPGWLKGFFFTVLPIAYMNYVPLLVLLGKGGHWTWLLSPFLTAVMTFTLAYRFWLYGHSRYHSTGS